MDGLKHAIAERLESVYGFRPKETGAGLKLVLGRCPSCNEPEAYTPPGNPFIVICPRGNKCGDRTLARDLFPDLFDRHEQHHPATQDNPNATAESYLRARGIDPATIRGWFTQGRTPDPEDKSDSPRKYPTVQFTLANGVQYHRLVDYAGRNKNKIVAAFSGSFWEPPKGEYPRGDLAEIWIAEGVLDAVSLIQSGRPAVANLTAKHVPSDFLDKIAGRKINLVIAQDGDAAGRESAGILASACAVRGIPHRFAFAPDGLDWNDLLVRGEFAEDRRDVTFEMAEWRGNLHAAGTAGAFHEVWRRKRHGSLFAFREEYWVARPGREEGFSYTRLSDFTMERLYRLRLEPIADRPEYSEVVRVFTGDTDPHEVVLSGTALAKNGNFREALFTGASAQWDGDFTALNLLLRKIRGQKAPTVKQIENWGYDRGSNTYFFHDAAYCPDGRRTELDARGIVRVGKKYFKVPHLAESEEHVWLSPSPGIDVPRVLQLLDATSPHGFTLAALGFFTAGLFADQICRDLGMFPFLSVCGDPHTGKSSLLVILNRMLGREWEGIPVSEANTKVGVARYIAAYSNLPVVLTEADAHDESILQGLMNFRTAYNRGPIRLTGIKSGDNSVRVTPFRGALVFGWNDEVHPDPKVKERMVSVRYVEADNSDSKLEALTELNNIPAPVMTGFLDGVLTRRKDVLGGIRQVLPVWARWFQDHGVGITRTANNHAVPMAGLSAVLEAFQIDEATTRVYLSRAGNGLLQAAMKKERELRDDPDDLQLFFDRIGTWLNPRNGDDAMLHNYSGRPDEIAVSMVEVETKFATTHLQFSKASIFKALRKSPHFLKANYPATNGSGKSVKCWWFKQDAIE